MPIKPVEATIEDWVKNHTNVGMKATINWDIAWNKVAQEMAEMPTMAFDDGKFKPKITAGNNNINNIGAILDELGELEPINKPLNKPKKNNPINVNRVIGKIFKYKPLFKYVGFEGNKKIRAGTTFVGVEVELEQVKIKSDILGTWNVIEDNSLKDYGKEFVTIPIQFKYLEVELKRLFSGLSHYHASDRCSVHVHLNARDFTTEELKTFIALYMIFEKSLYNFSGNRWNNNFCVPLAFYPRPVTDMLRSLSDGFVDSKWYKYFGFNMSPIFGGESSKIGTIEFRHMKGTTDPDYIIDWVNLIVSLKITAKKMNYNVLMEHLRTMNTTSGYYWLADHTFKDFKEHIVNQPTFKHDVEFCIATTKAVFLEHTNKQEEVIKIITKEGGVNCVDLSL